MDNRFSICFSSSFCYLNSACLVLHWLCLVTYVHNIFLFLLNFDHNYVHDVVNYFNELSHVVLVCNNKLFLPIFYDPCHTPTLQRVGESESAGALPAPIYNYLMKSSNQQTGHEEWTGGEVNFSSPTLKLDPIDKYNDAP